MTLALVALVPLVLQSGSHSLPDPPELVPDVLPWGARIGPSGASFGASASGFFNDDDEPDAAVLADDELVVLVNPGSWNVALTVATGILDLACMPGGFEDRDVAVTVGGGQVLLWRWDRHASAFLSAVVPGPWIDPRRVRTTGSVDPAGPLGPQTAPVVVWDAATQELHPLHIAKGSAFAPSVTSYAPIACASEPHDFAILHFDESGGFDVAIVDAGGARVVDVLGGVTTVNSSSPLGGALVPLREIGAMLPSRAAWIRQGPLGQKVRVFDAAGLEGPISLAGLPTAAGAAGRFGTADGEDLVLGLVLGGWVAVSLNHCTGSESLLTFEPTEPCTTPLAASGASGAATVARPVAADFDLDGWDDVLLLDEGLGRASLLRRVPPSRVEPPLRLTAVELALEPTYNVDAFLDLTFDRALLATRGATQIDVVVWPWYALDDYALSTQIVGWEEVDVASQTGPELHAVVDLAFTFGVPDLLGVEVRAMSAGGATLDTLPLTVVRHCEDFLELLALIPDAESIGEVPPDCPMPGGEYLGGIVLLPRLPPFDDAGYVPILPPESTN